MNQAQLYRAVARATGDPVPAIERLGFSLLVVPSARPRDRRRPKHRRPADVPPLHNPSTLGSPRVGLA